MPALQTKIESRRGESFVNAPVNLRYVIRLAATAALGGLLFGFDIAIITGAGPFLIQHFGLSDISLGWAFSCLLFGATVGAALAGRLSDVYGRRKILIWVAVLFAATSVATGLAPTFTAFVIARFAGGVAVGTASLLSPMYVAEVSPAKLRGRLSTLYQLSIVTGILVSFCINYLLRNAGSDNWRYMFLTGVIPSVVFLVLLLSAPETPRFLSKAGRNAEAFNILERIAGRESAEFEMGEIQASFRAKGTTWSDLFRPGIRRAVVVGFCLAILVHFSGINTIIDYAPSILRSAGWNIDTALFSTFVIGFTNFAFTIVSFWTIDRYGRRPLYIVGSLGMAVTLLSLMTVVITGQFRGLLVLLLILAYIIFFCSCIGPVFWTLVAEIFPNRIRGTAMTIPVLTQWVANAVVVLVFPYAFNRIGKDVTFGILAAVSLLQAVFTWFFVPETKGRSLEEIEAFWEEKQGRKLESSAVEAS
jgi:MFS transporter, SP family, arabinose:H+ symporter